MRKIIYGIMVNGAEVLVEAGNRHQAVRAATKPLVGDIRVLSGGEVITAVREGKTILAGSGNEEAFVRSGGLSEDEICNCPEDGSAPAADCSIHGNGSDQ